jgi:hypothetical protein
MKLFSGRLKDGHLSIKPEHVEVTSLHYATFVNLSISLMERSVKVFEYEGREGYRGTYIVRAKKDDTLFLIDWRTHRVWMKLDGADDWTLIQEATRIRKLRRHLKWRERQTFCDYSEFELYPENPELLKILMDFGEKGGC